LFKIFVTLTVDLGQTIKFLQNPTPDPNSARKRICKTQKNFEKKVKKKCRRRRHHPKVAGHRAGVSLLVGEEEEFCRASLSKFNLRERKGEGE